MNILLVLFKKRCEYLLKNIPELVAKMYEQNWSYRKDTPIKRIKELLGELHKNGDLSEGEENLDEIISICVVWKNSFIDWDIVQKEEDRNKGWWRK
jgi:hypothetical protein